MRISFLRNEEQIPYVDEMECKIRTNWSTPDREQHPTSTYLLTKGTYIILTYASDEDDRQDTRESSKTLYVCIIPY